MKIKSLLFYLTIIAVLISCSNRKEYLPQEIFGLALKQKIYGDEAKNFVNKLHFNPVTKNENEIGFYENNRGTAAIYITYYSDKQDAEKDWDLMTKKISPQNSVFVASHIENIDGMKVYRTFGMGQSHFVFVKNNCLFWISVETVFGKEFTKEYLHLIR